MTALLTYSQWFTAKPSVANGACNGFSMTAWGYSRLRRASIRSGDVCYVLERDRQPSQGRMMGRFC